MSVTLGEMEDGSRDDLWMKWIKQVFFNPPNVYDV